MRKKNKTKISLFAFQDIITSTTGILILIAIILTFFLQIGGKKPKDGEFPTWEDVNQVTNLVTRIMEGNQYTNGVVKTWTGRDPARIESDIAVAIDQINQYSNRVNEIHVNNTGAAAIDKANKAKTNTIAGLEVKLAGITNEIARIKGTIRSFAGANRLFVIPEIPEDKNLILLVVGNRKIEMAELFLDPAGTPQTEQKVFKAIPAGPVAMKAALLAALRRKNPKAKYHIVFYVRRSGVEIFKQLSPFQGKEIERLGFNTFGWEPLEEDAILDFK